MPDTEKRIRNRMTAMGLSENQLADRTAIPRMTLRRRLANPKSLTLAETERICDVLHCSAPWLIFGINTAADVA
jgi:transcriptional regulator with XRE-family HTH domain